MRRILTLASVVLLFAYSIQWLPSVVYAENGDRYYQEDSEEEMSMEEAGGIHSEYTPRGWMKTEKELLIFEQHLYLRQPGYGTSYITGKYLLENAMAEYARLQEGSVPGFSLRDFFDRINSLGNIPISLGHWEMTGRFDHLKPILD